MVFLIRVQIFIFRYQNSKAMSQHVEVVLVEDNRTDAELTIRALKQSNLADNLLHLKDGAEALDFVYGEGNYAGRNIEDTPKLIIMDLRMPKLNGIDVLKKLKSDNNTKNIPIIILTSSYQLGDVKESYALGANSYVVKPVEFDAFVKVVSELGHYWLSVNKAPV